MFQVHMHACLYVCMSAPTGANPPLLLPKLLEKGRAGRRTDVCACVRVCTCVCVRVACMRACRAESLKAWPCHATPCHVTARQWYANLEAHVQDTLSEVEGNYMT